MEELKVALEGKESFSLPCMKSNSASRSRDISVDSLNTENQGKSWESSLNSDLAFNTASATFNEHSSKNLDCSFALTEGPSVTSICSEPVSRQKTKLGFVQSAMTDYLNSHRHSLSSVMELLDGNDKLQTSADNFSLDACKSETSCEPELESDEDDYHRKLSQENCSFYILSPIEENTEPSTESGSFGGSSGFDRKKLSSRTFSSSCDPMPSDFLERATIDEKYQTFPRTKSSRGSQKEYSYHHNQTMYPLEPRELDPSAFFQLHTADSQEELQEFLLLESECMGEVKGRGLAAAFEEVTDEELSSNEDGEQTGKLTN